MVPDDWTPPYKPYDLRERLFLFACLIVRLVQFLHARGPVAVALSYQILKSGSLPERTTRKRTTPRDLATGRIALRELKETLWRLRVARQSALLTQAHDPVIAENLELVKIVATVIRRSSPAGAGRDEV
jgi:hypothetical protein